MIASLLYILITQFVMNMVTTSDTVQSAITTWQLPNFDTRLCTSTYVEQGHHILLAFKLRVSEHDVGWLHEYTHSHVRWQSRLGVQNCPQNWQIGPPFGFPASDHGTGLWSRIPKCALNLIRLLLLLIKKGLHQYLARVKTRIPSFSSSSSSLAALVLVVVSNFSHIQ